jgi:hypothetical protein
MAGNVQLWSTTAASNDDADGDINFLENQTPASVNNSARGLMAGVAGWYLDTNGSITTGGSSNSYTITSNTSWTLATGLRITAKANHSVTGAATLTVNALGAKALRITGAAGADVALFTGTIVENGIYDLVYDAAANSAAGAWMVKNPVLIEAGTWTPGITFGGNSTGTTYSTQTGSYTRIGNRVFIDGILVMTDKGTSTGTAVIGGLPYTVGAYASAPMRAALNPSLEDAISAWQPIFDISTTNIALQYMTNTGSVAGTTDASYAGTETFVLGGSYRV